MRYTLTWLPEENTFRICREDGKVVYVQAPMFSELVSDAPVLKRTMARALEAPEKPVRFRCGTPMAPRECAENYQRSLVRFGSEDAGTLRLKRR